LKCIYFTLHYSRRYILAALLTSLIIISCPNSFVPSDEQCYAEKQALGEVNAELLDTQVNPAVWEISGHMVLKRKEDYEEASEENAWRLLAEVSLSEERFQEVSALIFEAIASVDNVNGNATESPLEEPDAKPKSREEVDAIHPAMVAGTKECLVLH
jgi:GDP-L-galactose phosphorylase